MDFGLSILSNPWVLLVMYLIALLYVYFGLRIIKIYVIVIGVLIGLVIGGVIGGVLGALGAGGGNATTSAVIGALVLGVLGGFIAWPLHKIIIALTTGVIVGAVAAVVAIAGRAPDSAVAAFLVFLVIGFIVALILYEKVVILTMSLTGGMMVFLVDRLFAGNGIAHDLLHGNFQSFFHGQLNSLILALVGYTILGWIIQQPKVEGQFRSVLRRLTVVFSAVSLLEFLQAAMGRSTPVVFSIILGPPLVAWPLIAIVTAVFLTNVKRIEFHNTAATKALALQLPLIAVWSVFLIPILSSLSIWIMFPLHYRPQSFVLFGQLALFFNPRYHGWTPLVLQWVYSAVVLSGCLYWSMNPKAPAEDEPATLDQSLAAASPTGGGGTIIDSGKRDADEAENEEATSDE